MAAANGWAVMVAKTENERTVELDTAPLTIQEKIVIPGFDRQNTPG